MSTCLVSGKVAFFLVLQGLVSLMFRLLLLPSDFGEGNAGDGSGDSFGVEHTGIFEPFVEVLAGHLSCCSSTELGEGLPSESGTVINTFR